LCRAEVDVESVISLSLYYRGYSDVYVEDLTWALGALDRYVYALFLVEMLHLQTLCDPSMANLLRVYDHAVSAPPRWLLEKHSQSHEILLGTH